MKAATHDPLCLEIIWVGASDKKRKKKKKKVLGFFALEKTFISLFEFQFNAC